MEERVIFSQFRICGKLESRRYFNWITTNLFNRKKLIHGVSRTPLRVGNQKSLPGYIVRIVIWIIRNICQTEQCWGGAKPYFGRLT